MILQDLEALSQLFLSIHGLITVLERLQSKTMLQSSETIAHENPSISTVPQPTKNNQIFLQDNEKLRPLTSLSMTQMTKSKNRVLLCSDPYICCVEMLRSFGRLVLQ